MCGIVRSDESLGVLGSRGEDHNIVGWDLRAGIHVVHEFDRQGQNYHEPGSP